LPAFATSYAKYRALYSFASEKKGNMANYLLRSL